MKKIMFLLVMLLSFNCYAETITITDNKITVVGESLSEKELENELTLYFNRLEKSKNIVDAEIKRKHELDIEVAKFKNAIMLERAGASNINVSSYSINRNETVNSLNTGRIRNQNNSTK